MARPKKKSRLWRRNKKTFYYMLEGMTEWKSTGCTKRTDAENWVTERLKSWEPPTAPDPKRKTLREFIDPYFVWDRCPRIAERRADGKRISRQHADRQRAVIESHILTDSIADLNVRKITRGDIRAFKKRLTDKHGKKRVVNSVLGVLKAVFHDAAEQGVLREDPSRGIGQISYKKKEAGIFTAVELKELFPTDGLGPWKDKKEYTVFLTAATTGLRRGELLALRWKDIDFEKAEMHVERAWKDDTEIGEPKWGQERYVPLPVYTIQKLKEHRAASLHVLPDGLIFCYPDGSRLGTTWFGHRFNAAMDRYFQKKAEELHAPALADWRKRALKPHSFRHSLNTLLRDQGVPDEKIRAALGWTNEATQRGYTHFGVEHLRGQAKIIDGIFDREA